MNHSLEEWFIILFPMKIATSCDLSFGQPSPSGFRPSGELFGAQAPGGSSIYPDSIHDGKMDKIAEIP